MSVFAPHYHECPECGRTVRYGEDHREDCRYWHHTTQRGDYD